MNKKDIPLVGMLVLLLLAWPYIYKRYFPQPEPPAPPPTETVTAASEDGAPGEEALPTAPEETALDVTPETVTEPVPEPEAEPSRPERTVELADDQIVVTVSSKGATIRDVTLNEYSTSVDTDSGPVVLDFSERPALAYSEFPGMGANRDFDLHVNEAGREVVLERTTSAGLKLTRTIRLVDGYILEVTDAVANTGTTDRLLPAVRLELGTMEQPAAQTAVRGMVYLGVDALLQGGDGVENLAKKLPGWFAEGSAKVDKAIHKPADWVAAKNKFFVQILTPDEGMDDVFVHASRVPGEKTVSAVAAAAVLPAAPIPTGGQMVREFRYYVGPKKYSILKGFGLHQTKIMELGWFERIGAILLWTLNLIQHYLWPHNYGLAIMLLTIIIRIVFWPLTHKGTENMKRMQEIQPLMKEVREKFKDNAQKQQQEMMALYKKHKVNPMMGCLPMVIQIPVFISLFYVLRSAIELRYAEFLWVRDLSEPENLIQFGFTIPLLGWQSLNILPLFMSATTLIQQRLTPTAGDPSQQKIMMMMPFIMLIFLYNFASGLVLYWTTNNLLMIAQQLMQRRRAKPVEAAASG